MTPRWPMLHLDLRMDGNAPIHGFIAVAEKS
jgi:hypothetical protein